MAYVTVPKDFTRVKSKVVFGLTKRQLICFGGALLVGVPLFFLLRGRVPTSAAAEPVSATGRRPSASEVRPPTSSPGSRPSA